MSDMLVRLYDLPDPSKIIEELRSQGIIIRRSLAPEKHIVLDFVRNHWGQGWANQADVAYANSPISCFVAVQENNLLGFAVYDSTCRNFFGPTGVDETSRGKGIGKALLLSTLKDIACQGYGYAIVGGVGPVDFYAKAIGAVVIENSHPGVYRGVLHEPLG